MTESEEWRTFGPPGTGKTTWMTRQARRHAEKFGPDQVSVVSLTRAAVAEAFQRDIPIDEDNITTLHARCKRAIGAGSPAEDYVRDFVDANPTWSDAFPPSLLYQRRSDESEDESILAGGKPTVYDQVNILRQQMIPQSKWHPSQVEWYRAWSNFCLDIGHYDFTGWLEACLDHRVLPAQSVVYVDEAQDHTPLQLAVIRAWDCRYRILIGDDDQNLYEWSGAIPQLFYMPELDSAREKVLHQSYRVPRAVHARAMSWVATLSQRREKQYLPRDADGAVLTGTDGEWLDLLADPTKVISYADSLPGSTMILASCNFMLKGLIDEMRGQGMAFHNPYRRSNRAWNPLETSREGLRAYTKSGTWTGNEIRSWARILKREMVFQPRQGEAFMRLCEDFGDDEVPVAELRKAFKPDMFQRVMMRDLDVLRNYRLISVPASWSYALDLMAKPKSKREPRIIVGTVHSVKGGQADNVILFPDLSWPGYAEYQTASLRDRVLRLFYVGMTRARENLILGESSSRWKVQW